MLPALAAGALESACVLTAPAGPTPVSYGSNGVTGVSTQPRGGWATTFIPPSRYRVDPPSDVAGSLHNVTLTVA